jgi:enoyl-CoA hydratase/carnithine racemase
MRLEAKPAEDFIFKELLYEKEDWVARITLNRPDVLNALSTRLLVELTEAVTDASWDDGVAVIVLTGAGDRAFCAGGDVGEYADHYVKRPRDYWKYMGVFQGALDAIRNSGKPVVARLNGVVVGGGNELHLACDLAVAADHVRIRQVGARAGSVAAAGATQWLPLLVGDRRAREMLMTCDEITARQALEWGLVNRVVPYAELDQAVHELCQKLIHTYPECLRYTKAQANFWKDLVWALTVPHARDWLTVHYASLEPQEGMTAFVEKRPWDYLAIRRRAAEGKSSEFRWGPYTKNCQTCGAKYLPEEFAFCGRCGEPLFSG